MNKYLYYVLLFLALSSFSLSLAFAAITEDNHSSQLTPEEEIILTAEQRKGKRTLPIVPNIRAFVSDGWVSIQFNEVLNENVSIYIANEYGVTVYSDVVYVDTPTTYTFYIDPSVSEFFTLEIAGTSWVMAGEF
jgi:Protein of unknown function (DUF3244).